MGHDTGWGVIIVFLAVIGFVGWCIIEGFLWLINHITVTLS